MKYTLIVLLAVITPVITSAQKHHLYADVATPLGSGFPGGSLTYNYRLFKWFGLGIGAHGYKFSPTRIDTRRFIPSVSADIRFNIRPEKNNQFFSFLDLGIDFYKEDKSYYRDSTSVFHIPHNNGFYSGLGLGYFRRMTKRGGGPYASLKMILNWYTYRGYSIVSEEQDIALVSARGNIVFSLGFKF